MVSGSGSLVSEWTVITGITGTKVQRSVGPVAQATIFKLVVAWDDSLLLL